jgi:hypothetical protein
MPIGGGLHGFNEFFVTAPLETYRRTLVQFVKSLDSDENS